jgi:hypothetical protein
MQCTLLAQSYNPLLCNCPRGGHFFAAQSAKKPTLLHASRLTHPGLWSSVKGPAHRQANKRVQHGLIIGDRQAASRTSSLSRGAETTTHRLMVEGSPRRPRSAITSSRSRPLGELPEIPRGVQLGSDGHGRSPSRFSHCPYRTKRVYPVCDKTDSTASSLNLKPYPAIYRQIWRPKLLFH